MFGFALNKVQVWVTMALLVLCVSICPHSGYPHAEEDEDPTAAKELLDSEEDQELSLDEDEALEGEQAVLDEATDVEDDRTKSCGSVLDVCKEIKCCDGQGLECKFVGGTVQEKLCLSVAPK